MAYQTPAQQLSKGSRPHSNHLDSTSFIRMTRVHSLPHSRHHSPPTTPDSIFSSLALSMLTYSHRVSPSSSFFQISSYQPNRANHLAGAERGKEIGACEWWWLSSSPLFARKLRSASRLHRHHPVVRGLGGVPRREPPVPESISMVGAGVGEGWGSGLLPP